MSDKTVRPIHDPASVQMPSAEGPLVQYGGERPARPNWFRAAIETPYAVHRTMVLGSEVYYQTWGTPDKPGLMLIHGNGAHSHWWDFIAPDFADRYYVVAPTFSGMGDSAWRQHYDMAGFVEEIRAVAEVSNLFAGKRKPILAAHSFGGFVTIALVAEHGELFRRAVIIDSPIHPPDEPHRGPPRTGRPNKVYPTLTAALARFRLAPPQPCENHFAMDYIARHSLKPALAEDGTEGWTWKFDPSIWTRFDMPAPPHETLAKAGCQVDFMRGAESILLTDRVFDYMQSITPSETRFVSIPKAQHHVMLDQPLAFRDELTALIEN